MEMLLAAIGVLTLLLLVVLVMRTGKAGEQGERLARIESELESIRQETGASVQQSSIALSGLITKSDADMRQEVADRIARGLTEIRDRLDAEMKTGRAESASSMTATTESVLKRLGEFGTGMQNSIAALEKKTAESLEAIRGRVDARLEAIGKQVQEKLDENIKEGFAHFEKVQEHLQKAEAQLRDVTEVGRSINELNSLLKLPHLRGGFGEAALEVLINDFLPSSLYETQAQVAAGSPERVDVLIKLPGANLPIDSKFPREQVMALFETSDSGKLAEARKVLSRTVKELAKDIAAKYIRPDAGTTDMALMFLPSETLYFEIIKDAELWGFMHRHKVYPVSPNTLAVTLKGIALSYEYYLMAKSVEDTIEDIKKAQKHFGHFSERFDNVGKQLERARTAYDKANTHLGRYSSSVTRLTGTSPELPEADVQQGENGPEDD